MRKGIKKWRSRVAKANDLNNKLGKALKANKAMEGFIKDVYYSARNCRPLTVTTDVARHLIFLREEVGIDFKIRHNIDDRDEIELMSPAEVEMRSQEERQQRRMDMDSRFDFKCY